MYHPSRMVATQTEKIQNLNELSSLYEAGPFHLQRGGIDSAWVIGQALAVMPLESIF